MVAHCVAFVAQWSGTLFNTQHAEKLLMSATEASSLSRLQAISSKEVKAIRVIVSWQ